MLPKMLLIVLLVSCVSAELVQLNKDNIPEKLKDVVTVEDGKMAAECRKSDGGACEFNFTASFSSEKLFNFFFEKKCPATTVVSLDGSSDLIPGNAEPKSNLSIYSNGTLLLNGNARQTPWHAGFKNDVVNATIILPMECQFKLTEGTVLVPSVATSNGGTTGTAASTILIYILVVTFSFSLFSDM